MCATDTTATSKGNYVICIGENEPGQKELYNVDSFESMYNNEGSRKMSETETPQTKGNTTNGKPLHQIARMKTSTGGRGAGGTRQKCDDCVAVKNGKIYEDDGLFYCWQCWEKYVTK
eukprot:992957_1